MVCPATLLYFPDIVLGGFLGFDYTEINNDRDCAAYMAYEPGLDPREHFQLKESRRRADRIRWTTLGVGVGTIAAVLLTGALNLIF